MGIASSQTSAPVAPKASSKEVLWGVNEIRLNARQWLITFGIVLVAMVSIPRLWPKIEPLSMGPDYRIPYTMSQDYWLYEQRLMWIAQPGKIILLGDSVVWGEYVLPNGTLSHFLNREAGQPDKYANAGVNGLFPLALEGLVHNYGGALRRQKVLVQCNPLWMSSPKADMQTQKEEKFNHSHLVSQFKPRIPCYKADASARLSVVVERNLGLVAWVNHLQSAYFGGKSILNWTLQDDGGDPPRYPNCYKNPLAQITLILPTGPANDSERGPGSARHRPWYQSGASASQFEWIALATSLQWGGFQRLLQTLQERGNEVFVILGPFNEHMIANESKPAYRKLHDGMEAWLTEHHIPHLAPRILPRELYADASHPLTEGYALLSKELYQDPGFQAWIGIAKK